MAENISRIDALVEAGMSTTNARQLEPLLGGGLGNVASVVPTLGKLGKRTKTQTNEMVMFAPGDSLVLIDTTNTPGPGCIKAVDTVLDGGAGWVYHRDCMLDIYIDGSATPIRIEMHNFGTTNAATIGAMYTCPHIYFNNDGQLGFSYPIPYERSIKMVWVAKNVYGDIPTWQTPQKAWTTVVYEEGYDYGIKFKCTAGDSVTQPTYTSTQYNNSEAPFHIIVDEPRGTDGVIAGLTVSGTSANISWLEVNVAAYIGNNINEIGTARPVWTSTGLEDFFQGAFYFQYHRSIPNGFVSNLTESTGFTGHFDMLSAYGGLSFDDGVKFVLERGLLLPGTPGGPVGLGHGEPGGNLKLFTGCFYYTR